MIKRHPFQWDFQDLNISEEEHLLQSYLESYVNKLPSKRREYIFRIAERLWDADI